MKTQYIIQNLKCGGCASTVTKGLAKVSNVSDITIDVEKSEVSFSHPEDLDLATIHKTLSDMGYPIEGDPNGVGKKAKSYVSCMVGKMGS